MRRLTIDHATSGHGRPSPLLDDAGRSVLDVLGDWAITNRDGRTELFLTPDLGAVARDSIVSGLIGGLIGGPTNAPTNAGRNAGEGRQTVKRARVPMRGVPFRWTPVATVSRRERQPGEVDAFDIVSIEATLPPVAFEQRATAADLAGYQNGYADPRFGVYDLVRTDGRPVLRHWSTIGDRFALVASTFDVEDDTYPLAEAVILCLARWHAWRF